MKTKIKKFCPTVEDFRELGYKVDVQHNRRINIQGDFSPKGGTTNVFVKSPKGIITSATAECHCDDNYNRKRGVRIALGRVWKTLQSDRGVYDQIDYVPGPIAEDIMVALYQYLAQQKIDR